jgi:hypothetical protein
VTKGKKTNTARQSLIYLICLMLITSHIFSQSRCINPILAAIFSNNSLYSPRHAISGGEAAKTTADTGQALHFKSFILQSLGPPPKLPGMTKRAGHEI